jgi:hypothetical protein
MDGDVIVILVWMAVYLGYILVTRWPRISAHYKAKRLQDRLERAAWESRRR